jgi:heme/copper-type cytochrome/quinol oxidase subunit 2
MAFRIFDWANSIVPLTFPTMNEPTPEQVEVARRAQRALFWVMAIFIGINLALIILVFIPRRNRGAENAPATNTNQAPARATPKN